MKKDKEKKPILYEKYKLEHNLGGAADAIEDKVAANKIKKSISHFITMIILIAMIFLSAIGVIAICNPQIRMILLNMIGM